MCHELSVLFTHVAMGGGILVSSYTTLYVPVLLWMDIGCCPFLVMVNTVGA